MEDAPPATLSKSDAPVTPLSPSRLANSSTDVGNPAPATRKPRMVFEEDEDFFASAVAEAEMEGQQPDVDEDDDDLFAPAPVASTSRREVASADLKEPQEEVFVRRSVKEGKRKVVLEPEVGFGHDRDVDMEDVQRTDTPTHETRKPIGYSYTARYSNLSGLNLNFQRPGYIEAAPIAATSFNGKRIIFSRRRRLDAFEESATEVKDNSAALAQLSHAMLEVPYHKMVDTIKKGASLAKKQAEADATNTMYELPPTIVDGTLWTDRYRPKKFTDLLGDERVHRSALLWLKEWDQCVFKGSAKTSAAAELQKERRKKRERDAKFDSATAEEEKAPDPYGRPQEKILLLCGPPGLGKTTLAYVLARQAGYQVLEVNASDDRTGKVVEERIRNALESRALSADGVMKGNRPTCVVIDEIDGAAGGGESGFVRTLVKLVTEGTATRKYKGKGKKDRPLLRPIICICNDLYAPVLRPLRALARIVRFSPPTNVMLVRRLRTICDEEGLGADSKNLTMLAEVAEGDLRSCLNTLQFIKRKSTVVDEAAIRSTVVGLKDTGTSSTTVIERLFKKPTRKKGGGGTDDKYVNRIVRDVQTCGEFEKISQGCFENYLGARQTNEVWPTILEAHDWLFLYDRLSGRLQSDRDYELWPYIPYTFVPWYRLFSSHTAKPLEYPKAEYEAYLKRVAHEEIAAAFAQSIPQSLKTLFTGANIAAELLPLINRIISPDLKPLNSQLIKTEERVVMLKLINQMFAMKLSFVQDRNDDGQLTYKLDPPIDVFVHYEGKRATDIATSRYAVRHLITREMEAEQIRRADGDGTATTANDILAAYKLKPEQVVKPEVKDAVDFFGRAIAIIPRTAEEAAAPPPPKRARHAVYRFHEGFSNAVRVTKRVTDFLT